MVKLVENNGQYKLTVPLDLIKDKQWKPGTEFRFVEDADGRVFLKVIGEDLTGKAAGGKQ